MGEKSRVSCVYGGIEGDKVNFRRIDQNCARILWNWMNYCQNSYNKWSKTTNCRKTNKLPPKTRQVGPEFIGMRTSDKHIGRQNYKDSEVIVKRHLVLGK